MSFRKLNSLGFTLVELMVVVAIIGILSAIAVPNFKKYQNKSKQSEAKIQLAAVYSTEVAAQADYDSYGTCLTDLGYDTPPKGYYVIGFTTAYVNGITARSATCSTGILFSPSPSYLKANAGASNVAGTDLLTSTAQPSSFTAAASGNIKSSSSTFDKWSITDQKALSNVADI